MLVSQYFPELHELGEEGVEITSRSLSYISTVKPGTLSCVLAQQGWHIPSDLKGPHYNPTPGPDFVPTYP